MRTELVGTEAGILRDRAHRDGVDRIMARNGEANLSVTHDHVPRLAGDSISELLKDANRFALADARQFRHRLKRNFSFFHPLHALFFCF